MDRSDRKSEIVAAAARLFREKGYSAVSVRDIATALDIKAASLYNHIVSKQEILEHIVIRTAERFTDGINRIGTSDQPVLVQLRELMDLHIDLTLENSDAMACLNNDWMHLAPEALEYYIKMRNRYEEKFRSILKKGVQEGVLADLHPDVMLFSLLSTLRTLHVWYGKKRSPSAQILKADLSRALLSGIVA
jgi:AcrR family transcriptional regulator